MPNIKINQLPTTALPSVSHLVPAQSPEGITQALTVQQFIDLAKSQIVDGADGAYDTLKEIEDLLKADDTAFTALQNLVNQKADTSSVYTQSEVDAMVDAADVENKTFTRNGHTNSDGLNTRIVAPNIFGDTNVALKEEHNICLRIGNVAIIGGYHVVDGFSFVIPTDTGLSYRYNVAAEAQAQGWYDHITTGAYANAWIQFSGSGVDFENKRPYSNVESNGATYPNSLYCTLSEVNTLSNSTATSFTMRWTAIVLVSD